MGHEHISSLSLTVCFRDTEYIAFFFTEENRMNSFFDSLKRADLLVSISLLKEVGKGVLWQCSNEIQLAVIPSPLSYHLAGHTNQCKSRCLSNIRKHLSSNPRFWIRMDFKIRNPTTTITAVFTEWGISPQATARSYRLLTDSFGAAAQSSALKARKCTFSHLNIVEVLSAFWKVWSPTHAGAWYFYRLWLCVFF